ncbi:hypothetical protein [Methylobacterium sp. E-046]|uniref:hypothetical protein n=1 Tax=Methylobacterium sp. E-046 TaxID=2836576 RepID=UPI001FBB6B8D|nr:hypothetical protein [Methylobacterium sp. E-046]MCJ2097224.1 hypothetical protein [Methylobacterium sp. E-046]
MGEVHTLTPRASAPQSGAVSGPVTYPALTREQARSDLAFGLRACRDHLDGLIRRVEEDCPVVEAMARAKVLNEGLEASGRVLTAFHQLGDPPLPEGA